MTIQLPGRPTEFLFRCEGGCDTQDGLDKPCGPGLITEWWKDGARLPGPSPDASKKVEFHYCGCVGEDGQPVRPSSCHTELKVETPLPEIPGRPRKTYTIACLPADGACIGSRSCRPVVIEREIEAAPHEGAAHEFDATDGAVVTKWQCQCRPIYGDF